MVFSLAKTFFDTAKNVTSPLTSNVVATTILKAPAAVLGTAKNLTAPVTGAIGTAPTRLTLKAPKLLLGIAKNATSLVKDIPSTVVNAPKVVLNIAKNTTKVIAKGVSGTASALNPFSFFGKLTRAATIGIAVGVGLAVFIFLMCCLVSLWQCRRRRKQEEERLVYYSPPPKAGFGFPPYDKTYQGSPQ